MQYEFRWYKPDSSDVFKLQYRQVSADGLAGEDWRDVPYISE